MGPELPRSARGQPRAAVTVRVDRADERVHAHAELRGVRGIRVAHWSGLLAMEFGEGVERLLRLPWHVGERRAPPAAG